MQKTIFMIVIFLLGFFAKTEAQIRIPKTPETQIKFGFQFTGTTLPSRELPTQPPPLWAFEINFETDGSHHHAGVRPDGEIYFLNGIFSGSKSDIYTYLSFNPWNQSKFFSLGWEREWLPNSVFFLEINKEIDTSWGCSIGAVYFMQPKKFFNPHHSS